MRLIYQAAGLAAAAIGIAGAFLPLVPTVPFLILAAWCFARGNPAWERRLLAHPVAGAHIRAWRERGAISRKGKIAATITFVASAAVGLYALDWPWLLAPLAIAAMGIAWIATRPD